MFVRPTITKLFSHSRKLIASLDQEHTFKIVSQNVMGYVNRRSCAPTRCYSEDCNNKNKQQKQVVGESESIEIFDLEEERNKLLQNSDLSKYEVFKDADSPMILDVEEEKIFSQTIAASRLPKKEFEGVSLERGIHGVFDVSDLVQALKLQSAQEITVIKMPAEAGYADHLVIVTGKSTRHLKALANYVRTLFKKKMHPNDKIPVIEGKVNKSDEWLALDMGNIILHIFSKRTRETYDLESLWALGPEFDPHLNEVEDPFDAIISKHSSYLADLEPADKPS